MPTNNTAPIGLRWPQELFDLYQAKAAELTHLSGGKHKYTVSSLAISAIYTYADKNGWLAEAVEREKEKTEAPS